MRIAICDDSLEYIKTIESYFDEIRSDEIQFDYDTYNNGESLLEKYKDKDRNYDIILLDMEMTGIDGIETANIIRRYDKKCLIIFITSYSHYALKSFECHPFDFLIKPISFEKFRKILSSAYNYLSEISETFTFQQNKKTVRLLYGEILYFENKSHWIYIYTRDTEYKIYMSFKQLLKELNSDMFILIHNSYIVNINHIRSIDSANLTLDVSDIMLPISRSKKYNVKEAFTNYIGRKYPV